LLRQRDGYSIPTACIAIAQAGAIKGKPATLQERNKKLTPHWKTLLAVLRKFAGNDERYVKFLEDFVSDRLPKKF
jgi:hypothetical protein